MSDIAPPPRRMNLGQVLRELGRIDEEDQLRALTHQEREGGYFGEALVKLGVLTSQEVEFGLAKQFDLPYVFPELESVNREAAEMVSPEWALAHTALPIAKTDESLTVVVDSPLKAELLFELEDRIGLAVEMALATPEKIRELIRGVFHAGTSLAGAADAQLPGVSIQEFVETAMADGASPFGISVRGERALGWWATAGVVRRVRLLSGWRQGLQSHPDAREEAPTHFGRIGPRRIPVRTQAGELPVQMEELSVMGGEELVFRPIRGELQEPSPPSPLLPPPSILAEIRLLVEHGARHFGVRMEPEDLQARLLPRLPLLLLGRNRRSVHLTSAPSGGEEPGPPPAPGVAILHLEGGEGKLPEALGYLRAFHLDGITARLPGPLRSWAPSVQEAAETSFLPASGSEDREFLRGLGVRWEIRIREEGGGELDWELARLAPSTSPPLAESGPESSPSDT